MAASDDFYNDLLPEVNQTLLDFGTYYTVRTRSTYDPDTLGTVPGTTRSALGLVADQSTAVQGDSRSSRSEATSRIGLKSLLLAADSDPKPEEEVEVDGVWFSLEKIDTVKPAEVVMLYTLDLTR